MEYSKQVSFPLLHVATWQLASFPFSHTNSFTTGASERKKELNAFETSTQSSFKRVCLVWHPLMYNLQQYRSPFTSREEGIDKERKEKITTLGEALNRIFFYGIETPLNVAVS